MATITSTHTFAELALSRPAEPASRRPEGSPFTTITSTRTFDLEMVFKGSHSLGGARLGYCNFHPDFQAAMASRQVVGSAVRLLPFSTPLSEQPAKLAISTSGK